MAQSHDRPELLIVGGPNGSGKTTMALNYIRQTGFPYLSADDLAFRISPQDVDKARIEAGREFLKEVELAVSERRSVIVETTLAGRGFQRILANARGTGFLSTIVFVIVSSADVCRLRVAERVRKGGHNVPTEDIIRRYTRSKENFWNIYRTLADKWMLVYNEGARLQEIAEGAGDSLVVRNTDLFHRFTSSLMRSDSL